MFVFAIHQNTYVQKYTQNCSVQLTMKLLCEARWRLRRDCAQIVLMTGGSLRIFICADCTFVLLCASLIRFVHCIFVHFSSRLCSWRAGAFTLTFVHVLLSYFCSPLVRFLHCICVHLILKDYAHDGQEPYSTFVHFCAPLIRFVSRIFRHLLYSLHWNVSVHTCS